MRFGIALVAGVSLAGCATPPPPAPVAAGGPPPETVYLVRRGWHTDIGVRADQVGDDLGRLRAAFPGVRTFVFGFGDRHWLLTKDHGSFDMLAALSPAPGALLVTALATTPQEAFPTQPVIPLHVSAEGLARLDEFLAGAFEHGADGGLRWLKAGPYPGSQFYATDTIYSGTYTCNTWTADGFAAAGLPVDTHVLLAGSLTDQARRIGQETR
jgi:uncharacterized protein (TIGR02117 family)